MSQYGLSNLMIQPICLTMCVTRKYEHLLNPSAMLQHIKAEVWAETPETIRAIITDWKKRKGYTDTPTLTLGYCIEYLTGISRNLHLEFSDGRTFNHILINNESVFGWDGEEPIDILFHEIVATLKKRIAASGTHNYTIP